MTPATPRLGFVDAGRLGSSLAGAVHHAGYHVVAVSRRDREAARSLAARLGPAVSASTDAQEVVDAADVVFLTTVDDRIRPLADGLAFRPGQTVVHCSGATPLSALDGPAAAGALPAGFHPLQTFPDEHGEDRFGGVTFGIESPRQEVRTWLERLARDLGGTTVTVDPATRALYHASAVLIGPLTAGLAGIASELWVALGEDRETGLRALGPLLRATAEHVTSMGLPAALTGPYARGDVEPVRAHLDALRAHAPETARAYAALALAQLPLAAERGNIPPARLRELRELLHAVSTEPRI